MPLATQYLQQFLMGHVGPTMKKGQSNMRNSYEKPEVFELGRTKEEILGTKPPADEIESVLGWGYRTLPLNDIDENDD